MITKNPPDPPASLNMETTIRFFRGIVVPSGSATSTIADIQQNGLQIRKSGWRMIAQDLKPHFDRLWSLPTITRADVNLLPDDQTPSRICACADKTSALFYACRKNVTVVNNTSLLITFEADISDIIVDGRDFLYTAFQLGNSERTRATVERLYGARVCGMPTGPGLPIRTMISASRFATSQCRTTRSSGHTPATQRL